VRIRVYIFVGCLDTFVYVCMYVCVCIGVCILVGCQDTFVYVFYQHRSMRAIWYLACQNIGICKTLNDMYVYDSMVYTYIILWNM